MILPEHVECFLQERRRRRVGDPGLTPGHEAVDRVGEQQRITGAAGVGGGLRGRFFGARAVADCLLYAAQLYVHNGARPRVGNPSAVDHFSRALEDLQCFLGCEAFHCRIGRARRPFDGVRHAADACARAEVIRELGWIWRAAVDQRAGNLVVEPRLPRLCQFAEHGLAYERVCERVAARDTRELLDQPRVYGLVERVEQLGPRIGEWRHGLDDLELELATHDGAHFERAVRLRRESTQSPSDDLADSFRHGEVGRGVVAPFAGTLSEVTHDFADEERIPPRLRAQARRQRVRPAMRLTRDLVEVLSDRGLFEPAERESLHVRLAPKVGQHGRERVRAVDVGVAIRPDDHH